MSPDLRDRYAARMRVLAEGDTVEAIDAGAFVAWVVPARVPLRPLWARRGGRVAVGNVRLDHPDEVRRWGATHGPEGSSLELLLDALEARGWRCLNQLLGDFGVVIYDSPSRTLVAARDAFGVKTLFCGRRSNAMVLSSHLEPVHENDIVDDQFAADFLLGGNPGPERTIWADSAAVAQGSTLRCSGSAVVSERFWTPYDHTPQVHRGQRDQAEEFRSLFAEAVRVRLEPGGLTWAELSGGLDSSSIVCMAKTLYASGVAPDGIAATVTVVDDLGSADERKYSDPVVEFTETRNELIANPWGWQEDGRAPPRTDEPRTHYPYFARDRLECELVREGGGRVLLSGMGSDHYLYGNRLYLCDLIARGHPWRAAAELAHWAIAERRSFWCAAFRDAVLPFLPGFIQRYCAPAWDRVPPWIEPAFARKTRMVERLQVSRTLAARPGQRFGFSMGLALEELTRWLPRGPFEQGIELRYPFLYRPLVEFSLRLPPETRSRPLASKWILRQAMRGILPEIVRSRPGKGAIDARILWALTKERERLRQIVADSHLARLGIIRTRILDASLDEARRGFCATTIVLLAALSLDTWFWVRAGRWRV